MTAIEQAHTDAQNAGYVTGFMYDHLASIDPLCAMEVLWMDPQWWQALGKARSWSDLQERSLARDLYGNKVWLYNWHRFIDHLADGKDAESFFASLREI